MILGPNDCNSNSTNGLCRFNDPDTVPFSFTCRNNPTRLNSVTFSKFVGDLVKFTQLLCNMCFFGLLVSGFCLWFCGIRRWLVPEASVIFWEGEVVAVSFSALTPSNTGQLQTIKIGTEYKLLILLWEVIRFSFCRIQVLYVFGHLDCSGTLRLPMLDN